MATTSNDQPRAPVPNPLWDFSLRIYSSKAVQTACIDLQDGCGVDVNVMLLMLYLASCNIRLAPADARALVAAIDQWRVNVVVPLRTARRNLKAAPAGIAPKEAEDLRQQVKRAELEAERLQQEALNASWGVERWPKSKDAATPATVRLAGEANLRSYGDALGQTFPAQPVEVMLAALQTLVENGAAAQVV